MDFTLPKLFFQQILFARAIKRKGIAAHPHMHPFAAIPFLLLGFALFLSCGFFYHLSIDEISAVAWHIPG
jgi:hypothetical protein